MTRTSLLLALCLSALLAAPASAERRLRACAHPAAQPMSWEQQGRMHGVCVEMARRAFAAAGWTLEVEAVGPWARCQALVERGDVDVMACAFDNPKRREYALVVEPALARNEAALFVRRDSPLRFDTWTDLAGLRVGVGRGVSFGAEVDGQLARQAQVDNALSEDLNLRKLLLGRLDAIATAREAGTQMLRAMGCEQEVRVLPRGLGADGLHLQISRRSPAAAAAPQIRDYLQQADYPAALQQLHRQQAELYRQQNPPPEAGRCAR
ncbi:transporter substrate-binding domain-containing protein [Roseateles sp.]|uniref:substrate-binding periplasmic protein n=1 Tax=Roseateles sp. TaxID=1971397 RepID=UPI0032672D0A